MSLGPPYSRNVIPTLVVKSFHKQILDLLTVGIFRCGLILFKAYNNFPENVNLQF